MLINKCINCFGVIETTESELFDTRFGIADMVSAAKCSSCGLEQITPLPTQENIIRLYENYYNYGGEDGACYTSLRQRFLFSPFYSIWMALDGDISFHRAKGGGLLLDIGCNEGRGLQFYSRNGWQPEGVELNTNAAKAARKLGFTVHSKLIEDFAPAKNYDVVVLSNVLEHSLDPRKMLGQIVQVLKPGGQVWISCPNSKSFMRRLFGRFWINWHVPFHIVHFSPQTLRELLISSGFCSVEIKHETPALWVAHSLIARLCAKPGRITRQLRNSVLVASLILLVRMFLFPLLWLANRFDQGDCLIVTARRN